MTLEEAFEAVKEFFGGDLKRMLAWFYSYSIYSSLKNIIRGQEMIKKTIISLIAIGSFNICLASIQCPEKALCFNHICRLNGNEGFFDQVAGVKDGTYILSNISTIIIKVSEGVYKERVNCDYGNLSFSGKKQYNFYPISFNNWSIKGKIDDKKYGECRFPFKTGCSTSLSTVP